MSVQKNIISCAMAAMCAAVWAEGSVSGVTARQRYPWNGMIDISYVLTGAADEKYSVTISAIDKTSGSKLSVVSVFKADGSKTLATEQLVPGNYSRVWNAAEDLPSLFKSDDVEISVDAKELDPGSKKFAVMNLLTYDIEYSSSLPSGWSNDPAHKLYKMAMQRIEAGTFTESVDSGTRTVTITKPFYITIRHLTVGQMTLIVEPWAKTKGAYARSNLCPSRYSSVPWAWNGNAAVTANLIVYGYYMANGKSDYGNITDSCSFYAQFYSPAGYNMSIYPDASLPIGKFNEVSARTFIIPSEAQIVLAGKKISLDGTADLCNEIYLRTLSSGSFTDPQNLSEGAYLVEGASPAVRSNSARGRLVGSSCGVRLVMETDE